jgi:GAF domain-containing protein
VLELALGPRRGHGLVELADPAQLAQLGPASEEAAAAEITSVLALPLLVQEGLIGLLAVYPRRPVRLTPSESALLVALAAQLAVAVQNARLHEHATSLGGELEAALAAERESAKRLRALYEISGTFAQSLSLQTTLDVLARSIVTLLGVDAAVIRMPDERGVDFVARAVEVNDARVDAAARALLSRPQPLSRAEREELLERRGPLLLDARSAPALEGANALLAPFLEKEPPGPLLAAWMDRFRATLREGEGTVDMLVRLNQMLRHDVNYLVRMEPGVQMPDETLQKASGSCRDSGWLLVHILRHLGLAARFASGYLIQLKADQKSLDGPSGAEADFFNDPVVSRLMEQGATLVPDSIRPLNKDH